jgi:hypothetical protein
MSIVCLYEKVNLLAFYNFSILYLSVRDYSFK